MNQLGLFGPTTEVEPFITDEDRAPIDRCRARQFCVVKSEVSNMDEPSETV